MCVREKQLAEPAGGPSMDIAKHAALRPCPSNMRKFERYKGEDPALRPELVEVTPNFYGRGVPQEPQLPIGETRPPARKDRDSNTLIHIFINKSSSAPQTSCGLLHTASRYVVRRDNIVIVD
eukprot:1176774-Prorocentrum_minimum.AAC.1